LSAGRPRLERPVRLSSGGLRRWMWRLQAWWRARHAARTQRHIERTTELALRRLDGRVLRDLGLDRSQIESVSAAVARRSVHLS
jgi:uncharacterized protein YjiS (DUF1127 family)